MRSGARSEVAAGSLSGRIELPGDKSLSHRALILAALAEGRAELGDPRAIAEKNPDAIRAAKQLWNSSVVSPRREGFALEASLQTGLIGSPNQIESVKANFEKRVPSFEDPK